MGFSKDILYLTQIDSCIIQVVQLIISPPSFSKQAFSSNGQPTITTINPLDMNRLGNRDGLSFADIKLANIIYQCDADCTSDLTCQNGGYQGQDCTCVCPAGFSGDLCQDAGGPTEAPSCVQTLTASEGEITSPNYPSNYDNDQSCLYLIEVRVITTAFEIQPDGNVSKQFK